MKMPDWMSGMLEKLGMKKVAKKKAKRKYTKRTSKKVPEETASHDARE